jgi:hypothetical protein
MLQTNEQLVYSLKCGNIECMRKLDESSYLVLYKATFFSDVGHIVIFDPLGSETILCEVVKWDSAVKLFEQTFNNLWGK